MSVPKSLDWKKVKHGFLIQMKSDKKYVSCILANGHPENPVIYFTEYVWEAKAWKDISSVLKTKGRVEAQKGACSVFSFEYDEVKAERIICKCVY